MNKSLLRVRTVLTTLAIVVVSTVPAAAHAATVRPMTTAQCPSGNFCVWSSTGFRGTIQKISATDSYRTVTIGATQSYFNNRTRRTWLHATTNGTGSKVCINPGVQNSNTSGWQEDAQSAYLATVTNC